MDSAGRVQSKTPRLSAEDAEIDGARVEGGEFRFCRFLYGKSRNNSNPFIMGHSGTPPVEALIKMSLSFGSIGSFS